MSERKFRVHEEFYLSPSTLAIIPVQYGSKLYSKIIEEEGERISPFRPIDLIKKSCRYYASTFEGRREGTKSLIGVTHKAPIVIDPIQSIYFFPTASPTRANCSWISHENVTSYSKLDKAHTEVTFSNGISLSFPISFISFDNQMMRTALLRTKMVKRSKELEWTSRAEYQSSWKQEAMEKGKPYIVKGAQFSRNRE